MKAEFPDLLKITEPAVLRAQVDQLQVHWNTVRLHAGIGYVTPDDAHTGRGEQIRKDREAGLGTSPTDPPCPPPGEPAA